MFSFCCLFASYIVFAKRLMCKASFPQLDPVQTRLKAISQSEAITGLSRRGSWECQSCTSGPRACGFEWCAKSISSFKTENLVDLGRFCKVRRHRFKPSTNLSVFLKTLPWAPVLGYFFVYVCASRPQCLSPMSWTFFLRCLCYKINKLLFLCAFLHKNSAVKITWKSKQTVLKEL